jgi:hypothetical protein
MKEVDHMATEPIPVTEVEVAAARAYREMRGDHVHEAVTNLANAERVDEEVSSRSR